MSEDQPTGFTAIPVHYLEPDGRETIDRIRDQLGDRDFRAYCVGQVIKYTSRAGRKTVNDEAKARWYKAMVAHMDDPYGAPDPRWERPGFTRYAREAEREHTHIKVPVLDHGYVLFIEDSGYGLAGVPEAGIIEAARQSTRGAFRGWDNGDGRLLRYLYKHKHMGPFEFPTLTIEVQAPIMVFRQWHRHRTQSYNEMSARYVEMPDLDYVPDTGRILRDGGKNKQAQGRKEVDPLDARKAVNAIDANCTNAQSLYEHLLELGTPKEIARLVLPVTRYSRMRATANLRNWLGFLTLRTDPHAQWEIRQFANAVSGIVRDRFPRTHALWYEHEQARLNA